METGTIDARYIQIPLSMIRGIYTNKVEAIDQMLIYGIYRLSKNYEVRIEDAARQIIFEFYRGKLTHEIQKILKTHDWNYLGADDDYNGFSGAEFSPDDEISELVEAMNNLEELKQLSCEFYRIHLVKQTLKITGSTAGIIKTAKELESNMFLESEPMPMVSIQKLFEFRDNNITETDLIDFAAYIAVCSIIGVKKYVRTNKKHIVCRMFGYPSIKVMPDVLPTAIAALNHKYSTKRRIDAIIERLQLDWHVHVFGKHVHGLYIGLNSRISLNQLVSIAESQKKKTSDKT
jgi:hypothetical protein